jgi:antibiotic biosynthesis monooxygenase (ABM) superfamily enzyme
MLVIVFRSRLKPGLRDEYVALVDRMAELARTMPGYISQRLFTPRDRRMPRITRLLRSYLASAWSRTP